MSQPRIASAPAPTQCIWCGKPAEFLMWQNRTPVFRCDNCDGLEFACFEPSKPRAPRGPLFHRAHQHRPLAK